MDFKMMPRILEFSGALVALSLLSPVLLICSALVKCSSRGPVFFRQQRLGIHGTPFQILKFRTMYVDAPDIRKSDGSTYNSKDDRRLTPIGRRLRQLSIDELPQLINVVRGEMSIVGPRPDTTDAMQHYRAQDFERLSVRPGITGWAQIHGRNSRSWEQRRDLDLEYVRNRSVLLDIKIILLTVPVILLGRGVYGTGRGHARSTNSSRNGGIASS